MIAAAFFALAISFTPADAKFAYDEAAGLVREHTPRNAGTVRGRLAAGWILDRVSRTGVDASLDVFSAPTPDGEGHFANVSVEFPVSPAAPWVVLMSHFDTAPTVAGRFESANDGASTTGLLIALAAAVRRADPLSYNLALVWTDAEECRRKYGPNDGFQGSRRLVGEFRRRQRKVKAAICLDMLGDRDLNIIIPHNGDNALKRLALAAAARAGLKRLVTLADDVVIHDDHQAFHEAGIPAIDLIDFEFGSAPGRNDYWHTPADTMDKISVESLEKSGSLAAQLLIVLDSH